MSEKKNIWNKPYTKALMSVDLCVIPVSLDDDLKAVDGDDMVRVSC